MKTNDEKKKELEYKINMGRLRDEKAWDEHMPGSLLLKGRVETAKWAYDYITQLEARVPKWISVKDRLPESYETVIISREDCHEACIGWLIDGSWSVPKGVHVTHWMQLPELPKEELTHEAKRFFRNRARKSENMAVL